MTAGDAGYTIDPIRGQANDALLPAIPAPVVGWRLAAGGWRLAAGGWRLAAGGWRLR